MEPRNTRTTRKLNHLWNERRDWRWELGTGAGKIRRPKSEIRKMTEIRSPNGSHHEPGFELRPSDLLRISDFPCNAVPGKPTTSVSCCSCVSWFEFPSLLTS